VPSLKLVLALYRENLFLLLRATILFLAFVLFFNYLAALAARSLSTLPQHQRLWAVVLSAPITSYALGGYLYFVLMAARGFSARVAQLYRGYRWAHHIMAYLLLFYVFTVLTALPLAYWTQYPAWHKAKMGIWALVLFWLGVRTSLASIIIVDQKKNFWAALSLSFAWTRNRFWPLFGVWLFFFVLLAVGMALAGVGLIFTMPLAVLYVIQYYEVLLRAPARGGQL
jgi:hypothetical protein